jgi:hypothetical protein
MTLIVETGAGLNNSESYISVVDADTFHSNYGNTAWAALDTPTKEACLRRATAYMTQIYRLRWMGLRVSVTQALDWPRIGVILRDTASFFVDLRLAYTVPADVVPIPVQQACAQLALKASTQDLAPDLDQRVNSETIGPMKTDYDRFSPQYRRFRAVDLLLNPYLDGTNGLTVGLVRA